MCVMGVVNRFMTQPHVPHLETTKHIMVSSKNNLLGNTIQEEKTMKLQAIAMLIGLKT